MKSLVLFAFAVLLGSIHCDLLPQSESLCFGAAVKECWMGPIPYGFMELCDGVRDKILCLAEKLKECKTFTLWSTALELRAGVNVVCHAYLKKRFDEDKKCFQDAIVDNVCAESIKETNGNVKSIKDFIRANKKTCSLFDPYSNCVTEKVMKNCNNTIIAHDLFNDLFDPLRKFSNSLCEELIIPADEHYDKPYNFGLFNVYQSVIAVFNSA